MSQDAWMVVCRKELVDTLRDGRSLVMAFLFAWLGPLLAAVLAFTVPQPGLLPAFLMVVAFTASMPVAIDSMAGERERGSLEPLLLTAVPPGELIAGKWLAVLMLSLAGVVLNLACTFVAVHVTPLGKLPTSSLLWMFAAVVPLCVLASGAQLLVSTFARSHKEANSYLSFLVLAPMLIGILGEFFPVRLQWLTAMVPVLGQQRILSDLAHGNVTYPPWLLAGGVVSLIGGLLALAVNARLLRSEKVVFGR